MGDHSGPTILLKNFLLAKQFDLFNLRLMQLCSWNYVTYLRHFGLNLGSKINGPQIPLNISNCFCMQTLKCLLSNYQLNLAENVNRMLCLPYKSRYMVFSSLRHHDVISVGSC